MGTITLADSEYAAKTGRISKQMKKGVFIIFEGLDGAGKTTQAKLLVDNLQKRGRKAVYLKEPTDGRWGRKIRDIASRGRDGVTPRQELEFFLRDREEDVKNNILPALVAGKTVIMDRYIHSNMAYQGALDFDVEMIRKENLRFPQPDVVFFLDVAPDVGLGRITNSRKGGANVGYEKLDYLEKVYEIFRQKEFSKMIRINGERKEEEIQMEIVDKALALSVP